MTTNERRIQLANAGMFEIQRGQVWVPITTRQARRELEAGRPVHRYTEQGPVRVEELPR